MKAPDKLALASRAEQAGGEIAAKIKARTVVDENGCWLWQGARTSLGYGSVWLSGKSRKAHRLIYEALVGDTYGDEVRHSCGVRHCCNPDHLKLAAPRSPRDEKERLIEDFVDKVPSGCWEWTGPIRPNGYGAFKTKGRIILAHRHSYEVAFGKIPEGKMICHHCDNKRCVNPDHLYAGTDVENNRDRLARQRAIKSIDRVELIKIAQQVLSEDRPSLEAMDGWVQGKLLPLISEMAAALRAPAQGGTP